MIDFLTSSPVFPFSVALCIVLLLALIEALGFLVGIAASGAVDGLLGIEAGDADGAELTGTAVGKAVAWLHIGKVPVLIVMAAFLLCFGLLGVTGQWITASLTGGTWPTLIAVPAAIFASLPVTRLFTAVLARLLPRDYTQSVREEDLVGREARIVMGVARANSPTEAKLTDPFGTTHYIMCEPERAEEQFSAGDTVLLVSRRGHIYLAISNPQ